MRNSEGWTLSCSRSQLHWWAVVRNRVAFRYGFEFVRTDPAQAQIREDLCLSAKEGGRRTEMVQSLAGPG
jgi:hypothetical protein